MLHILWSNMSGWTLLILAICILSVRCADSSTSSLVHIQGDLVRVVDNCTVGDDSTCAHSQCCVREGLAYIPEYTGPRPLYQLACKPLGSTGSFCYYKHTDGFCPCIGTCRSNGYFGHCI